MDGLLNYLKRTDQLSIVVEVEVIVHNFTSLDREADAENNITQFYGRNSAKKGSRHSRSVCLGWENRDRLGSH